MGNQIFLTLRGPWRIPIQFDISLLLLAGLFALLFLDRGIVPAVLAFSMIIVAILLHELGHAAACVAQGVRVTRVVLFGGGGFCEHDARVTPRQAEFIAIAGPLVNLALWAICTLMLTLFLVKFIPEMTINGRTTAPLITGGDTYRALQMFAQLNLFLALFNLIPILPLDGGHLLHSWLHRFVTARSANKIVGGVGVIMSIVWIPLMFAAFFTFGFVLLFFPNLRHSWQMMRTGQA